MRRQKRINIRRGEQRESKFRRVGGFTLVEILIVVIILGILAAIVIPQFTQATQDARNNVLKETLRNMRTQINVYRAQHRDTSPGYPDGDDTVAATEADFIAQMTLATDIYGDPDATETPYGPYLRSIPENPIKNSATVRMGNGSEKLTGNDTNEFGWVFRPEDVAFIADSADPYDTY